MKSANSLKGKLHHTRLLMEKATCNLPLKNLGLGLAEILLKVALKYQKI
jgi:hypothetical protein